MSMNRILLVTIIMALFPFSSALSGNPEQKFWKWFQKPSRADKLVPSAA